MSALTLAHARACITRGLEEAERRGFKVAIAVVDEAGHLMACDRMDGALWLTPEIARAKANAADTIVKYPDIAGLVGLWAYNGPAILNAVKEAGKTGKIQIVCFDDDAQTLAGIEAGSIRGTIVQQPYEFGYQAIKLMEKVLNGDKSAIPATKQIIVPTLVVNSANVDEFTQRINTLRGR